MSNFENMNVVAATSVHPVAMVEIMFVKATTQSIPVVMTRGYLCFPPSSHCQCQLHEIHRDQMTLYYVRQPVRLSLHGVNQLPLGVKPIVVCDTFPLPGLHYSSSHRSIHSVLRASSLVQPVLIRSVKGGPSIRALKLVQNAHSAYAGDNVVRPSHGRRWTEFDFGALYHEEVR